MGSSCNPLGGGAQRSFCWKVGELGGKFAETDHLFGVDEAKGVPCDRGQMVFGSIAAHVRDDVREHRFDEAGEGQALLPVAVGVLPGAVLVVDGKPDEGDGRNEIEAALSHGKLPLGATLEGRTLSTILHRLECLDHAAPLERSVRRMPSSLAASKIRWSR
jgi:hypothetical protein